MKKTLVVCLGLLVSAALSGNAGADVTESGFQAFDGPTHHYTHNYATGQTTQNNPGNSFGPNVVWDATVQSGFFRGSDLVTAPPEETVDWGDLAGSAGETINGFQIGYVTDSLTPVDWQVNFYTGNGFGDASALLGSFALVGLPGSVSGGLEAVILDIDLMGGFEFFLGGPDVDGFAGADFEYGYMPLAGAGTGTALGPLITSGGFGEEDVFDTYEPGDQASGAPNTGSFFFGGAPFAQFHMRLYSAVPEPTSLAMLGLFGVGLVIRRRK